MKNIKVLCVTGGPCAGKTTLLEKLNKELVYDNLKVLFIPESGTSLMIGGIKPFEDNVGLFNFQLLNLQNQLEKERMFKRAAEYMDCENILIICDRSSAEQQIFIDKNVFNQILEILNVTEEELINSYDKIVHLITAAIGAEYAYGILSNKNRIHNLEEAKEQDIKALDIWKNHKNVSVIDNSTDFVTKIDKASEIVNDFIKENYKL